MVDLNDKKSLRNQKKKNKRTKHRNKRKLSKMM